MIYVVCAIWFLCFALILADVSEIIKTLQPPFFDYGTISGLNHPNQYLETSTAFVLPEIIVNRDISNEHWSYIPPVEDVRNLESRLNYIPPTKVTKYLPPDSQKSYIPPYPPIKDISNDIFPNKTFDFPDTIIVEASSYLPPLESPIQMDKTPALILPEPSRKYLPVTPIKGKSFKDLSQSGKNSATLRLELNELRCLPTQNGYFKAILTPKSFIGILPKVESDFSDSSCDPQFIQSKIVINLNANFFSRCGVEQCNGQSLCLKLRFPQISGMRSLGDSLLTLQCKTQERIVAKTHALRLGISRDSQARNIGSFAQGGYQQPFRTQIALYRMANNGFTRPLEPGGTVQLGEDLLLRAHVKSNDGWNHSRISDISLQRLSSTGQILNSAIVINANGCVNSAMISMCPQPPVFEPPLGHALKFKAVMFQEMKSGDEMAITARIVGCIEQKDCFVDKTACEKDSNRIKRSVTGRSVNISDISRISFRVEMPTKNVIFNMAKSKINPLILIGVIGIIGIVCFIAIIGLYEKNKNKVWRFI